MGGGGGGGGGGMKKTIRCCISCILPCGALDVVRIVHSDGRVEEISGTVRAGEIMKLHPKHVLKKPSSSSSSSYCDTVVDAVSPKIVIVPPDAELQRGKIYFLMPAPPDKTSSGRSSSRKNKRRGYASSGSHHGAAAGGRVAADLVMSDRYLSEILSEKLLSPQKQQDYRRRGRVGVWRPHLESISETSAASSDSSSS